MGDLRWRVEPSRCHVVTHIDGISAATASRLLRRWKENVRKERERDTNERKVDCGFEPGI